MQYSRELKKQLCENVCINGFSTIKTAQEYDVPLKTLENWITAFNKDNHCFDPIIETINDFKSINNPDNSNYNDLSNDELKILIMKWKKHHKSLVIMKKDIEIARLKKGYIVKEGGMGRKVFVTFSKKNMK